MPLFEDALQAEENNKSNTRGGWDPKRNRWFPHRSLEGGSDTIGSGHKLKPGERFNSGITDAQKNALFQRDLSTSMNSGKLYIQSNKGKTGIPNWNRLSTKHKKMIAEIEFNVKGGVSTFPSMLKAMSEGNDKQADLEYIDRKFTDRKGVVQDLSARPRRLLQALDKDAASASP